MQTLTQYLIVSTGLFCASFVGIVLSRRHILFLLLCIELMFVAIATNFLIFTRYWQQLSGQVMVLFILSLAAIEIAIGLAFSIKLRAQKTVLLTANLLNLPDEGLPDECHVPK
jgi:NADH-quinone oxidoreductase subunit K